MGREHVCLRVTLCARVLVVPCTGVPCVPWLPKQCRRCSRKRTSPRQSPRVLTLMPRSLQATAAPVPCVVVAVAMPVTRVSCVVCPSWVFRASDKWLHGACCMWVSSLSLDSTGHAVGEVDAIAATKKCCVCKEGVCVSPVRSSETVLGRGKGPDAELLACV